VVVLAREKTYETLPRLLATDAKASAEFQRLRAVRINRLWRQFIKREEMRKPTLINAVVCVNYYKLVAFLLRDKNAIAMRNEETLRNLFVAEQLPRRERLREREVLGLYAEHGESECILV
jgi:hypothetical protein